MPDEIKVGPLLRDMAGAELTVGKRADNLARIQFSASSEAPVERHFGTEVLSHDEGAVDMERFQRGAVPLLFNHSWDDPIGMVDEAALRSGRLMVDAHLFATQRAAEVQKMIDGGLRNVSIGYQINEVEEDSKRGTFRVTRWSPLEVSIVTVPADSSVGVGRSQDQAVPVRVVRAADVQPAAPAASHGGHQMADSTNAAAGATADVRVVDDFDPAKYEKGRAETIRKFAATNDITDERQVMHWIRSGKSWDSIADDILKVKEERSKASPQVLGLTTSEKQRFSIVRAINACVNRDWSKAGFEAEVSRATAQRMGKVMNEHTFVMPVDVLAREFIVGSATSGGYLVGTDIQPASFIELLRNRSVVMSAGARVLSGLQGSVTIPTQAAAGAVGWLLESGTATESNATVGQKTLSPKTVGGYQAYSRQLLLQSSLSVENLITSDLAQQIALAVDLAALAGTSTNSTQPLGIRFTSGLGTANPSTATNVSYADMIRFQSTIAGNNAMTGPVTYVCHPAVAAVLMGKPRFTNSDTPIWDGGILDGRVVGARAMASAQVTSGTMLAGDFSQVVVGEWGTVEIETNPYANFQAGIVGVRAMYSCDVLVRYGQSFAIGTGIAG
jgi:HK97 family phage major capsid protein/HK97 family phage prohead protease